MLKNELSGWKWWEVAWLVTAAVVITILPIYWETA